MLRIFLQRIKDSWIAKSIVETFLIRNLDVSASVLLTEVSMAKYSPKTLQTNIYRIVSRIPKGKVLTYGLVAKLVGIKNPRLVGSVLHKNINPKKIPCHRVVNARGKVASSY